MDSILLAVAVGVLVWLLMRRLRMKKLREIQARQSAGGEASEPKTMPRVGTPGTITRDQIARLKQMNFEPDRRWSSEEAQLIIDTVVYLRAAIKQETGESDAPLEIQNNVLAFILTDETLREYLMSWGQNRARRGVSDEEPELRRNEHYERVAEHIRGLWAEE